MNHGRVATLSSRPKRDLVSRGFSLIEALVALLVVSLGMLAIAGFQANLAGASDVAKQRMEALRLAQDKMETLRSFSNLTQYSGIANGADNPVAANASNALFARTWTVSQGPGDTERWVKVAVSWTDRRGNPQEVVAQSSIAKFDPQDIGTLATGPGGINVRKPKNRNLNIPYPAVTLSGGTQSAFIPPPGNVVYVFNNTSGNIEKSCQASSRAVTVTNLLGSTTVTVAAIGHPYKVGNQVTISGAPTATPSLNGTFTVTAVVAGVSFTYSLASPAATTLITSGGATATLVFSGLTEGLDLANSGLDCTDFAGAPKYLLSGYVRFDTSNNPSGAIPGNLGNNNDTLPLNVTSPLLLDASNNPTGYSGSPPTMTCFSQRQIILRASSGSLKTISSMTLNSSTGLVTITAASHGFSTGQAVAINGFVNSGATAVLGSFTITVTGTNTFTYSIPTPYPTSVTLTSGTAQLVPRITVAEGSTVTGYDASPIDRFISYACVVTPVDHDSSAATLSRWWGRVTLNPNVTSADGTVWSIYSGTGNSSGTYKICRYSADYNSNGAISNSEHPLWYRAVTGALDSQNYLVIEGGRNCPTDRPADPLGSPATFADNTTADHQPTGERSFQCPASGCGSKNVLEPSTTTTDLKMD